MPVPAVSVRPPTLRQRGAIGSSLKPTSAPHGKEVGDRPKNATPPFRIDAPAVGPRTEKSMGSKTLAKSPSDFALALVFLARLMFAVMLAAEFYVIVRALHKFGQGDFVHSVKPVRALLLVYFFVPKRLALHAFLLAVWTCARSWLEEETFGVAIVFFTALELYTRIVFGAMTASSGSYVPRTPSSHERFAQRVCRARKFFRRGIAALFAFEAVIWSPLALDGVVLEDALRMTAGNYDSTLNYVVAPPVALLLQVQRVRRRCVLTLRDAVWTGVGFLDEETQKKTGVTSTTSTSHKSKLDAPSEQQFVFSLESFIHTPDRVLVQLLRSLVPTDLAPAIVSRKILKFLRSAPDPAVDLWKLGQPESPADEDETEQDAVETAGNKGATSENVKGITSASVLKNTAEPTSSSASALANEDEEEEEEEEPTSAADSKRTQARQDAEARQRILHMAAAAGVDKDWSLGKENESIKIAFNTSLSGDHGRVLSGTDNEESSTTSQDAANQVLQAQENEEKMLKEREEAAAKRRRRREKREEAARYRHPLTKYSYPVRKVLEWTRDWLHSCDFKDLEDYLRWHIGTRVLESVETSGSHWQKFLRSDTCASLRRAYRRVSLDFHPDRYSGTYCVEYREGAFRVLQNLLEERKKAIKCDK
ncbi:unnamed protein product [Amoebophrya sp. A120]|nr:unnamed protein product [Amoebophrya sp. A120]|eukprot:GSA120T00002548001.1